MTTPRNPLVRAHGKEEAVKSAIKSAKHMRYVMGSLSAVLFSAAAKTSL